MLPDALHQELDTRVTESVAAFKRKLECFGLTAVVRASGVPIADR